ncbi:MAG: N-acetylmuramoyl-L-alanine amidase [Dyadobacter sp.]|uniref:N-acetylmuramoyl-L-alanine amidase n=1 Tax=Dyadobacter sp. TaxID=1914288 RepID=UPI003262D6C2
MATTPKPKRRVILTAGHQGFHTGAWREWFDEGTETIKLRDKITAALSKKGLEVTNDSDHERTGNVIRWVNDQYEENDLLIELHFNATDLSYPSGTEAFVQLHGTDYEKQTAAALCEVTSKVLGISNRGVKSPAFSQHQVIGILDNTKVQAVLLEVCFISNRNDVASYQANQWRLVGQLATAIFNAAKQ